MAPVADAYLAALFLSESPDNVSGLVDLALCSARAEPDPTVRRAGYADLDRLVSSLVPMAPIAVHPTAVIVAYRVQGYVPRPDGTFVVGALDLDG